MTSANNIFLSILYRVRAILTVMLVILPLCVSAQEDDEFEDPAQEEIDSLTALIKPNSPDSLKARIYKEIAYITSSVDTTIKYAELSLNFCSNNDVEYMAHNYGFLGWAFHKRSEDRRALGYALKSVDLYLQKLDTAGIVKSNILVADIYEYLNVDDSAYHYFYTALDVATRAKDTAQITYCYNVMGTATYNKSFKKEAVEMFLQSARMDSLSRNAAALSRDYQWIGDIYLEYYIEMHNDSNLYIASYYLKKAELINDTLQSDDPNDIFRKYDTYADLANVYINLADSRNNNVYADTSLLYYQKAHKFFIQQGYFNNFLDLENIYVRYLLYNKRYREAEKHLISLKEYNTAETPPVYLKQYHESLRKVYEQMGQWHKAYLNALEEYRYAMLVTDDSTMNAIAGAKAEQALLMEKMKHEHEEKEHITERKRLNTLIFSLIAGLIMVSLLVFYILKMLQIKKKSNEELSRKNEILNTQKAEIEAQRDEITNQKDIISKQCEDVEHINRNLISSIQYAQRIQQAAVSSDNDVKAIFPDSFVLYRPRDIVSGDFYRAVRCGKYSVMITADCTGHGIPGAFLSMLGISALKEYMTSEQDAANPGTVLDRMREFIKSTIGSSQEKMRMSDGMDMTICCFDFERMELHYAIANQTAIIVRQGKPIRLYGDNMPVGSYFREKAFFNTLVVHIEPGDMVYMFSDGIPDQLGGTFQISSIHKKYLLKSLITSLVKIAPIPTNEQSDAIEQAVLVWRGDLPQVDDITLVGIRV